MEKKQRKLVDEDTRYVLQMPTTNEAQEKMNETGIEHGSVLKVDSENTPDTVNHKNLE